MVRLLPLQRLSYRLWRDVEYEYTKGGLILAYGSIIIMGGTFLGIGIVLIMKAVRG
ncbi:MAG: hypothetical protein ABR607_04420 [Pyrinomonadaceae bacterium]